MQNYCIFQILVIIFLISSCASSEVLVTGRTYPSKPVDSVKVVFATKEPLSVVMEKENKCENFEEIGEVISYERSKIVNMQELYDLSKEKAASVGADYLIITESNQIEKGKRATVKGIVVKCSIN